jgi:hypothetical protein
MAGVKISDLDLVTQLQETDFIPLARGNTTNKIEGRRFASTTALQQLSSNVSNLVNSSALSSAVITQIQNLSAQIGGTVTPVKLAFTGTGSQTSFNLGATYSTNPANYRVDIDGLLQEPGVDYTISGNNIQFTTAPGSGDKIVVITANILTTQSLSSNVVLNNVTANSLTVDGYPVINTNTYVGGFKNKIINGDFRINQRYLTTNVFLTSTPSSFPGALYVSDRWFLYRTDSTGQLSLNVQTIENDAPPGFVKSQRIQIASPITNTSGPLTASLGMVQFVEGYNVSDLANGTSNAQPIAVSFWVKSSVPGTYGCQVRAISGSVFQNYGIYPFTYTINQTNVWEYKTKLIPANTLYPSNKDDFRGLELMFSVGHFYNPSTNLYVPTNIVDQWTLADNVITSATNRWHITGTTNLATQAAGSYWQVGGVQIEKGEQATTFEHRPYGIEETLCQRYYYNSYAGLHMVGSNIVAAFSATDETALAICLNRSTGHHTDGNRTTFVSQYSRDYETVHYFPTTMRTIPNLTTYSFDGIAGKASIWFQIWSPTLSGLVHDTFIRGNNQGYTFQPVQPVGTGPGIFSALAGPGGSYTILDQLSGTTNAGNPISIIPYSGGGYVEVFGTPLSATMTAKEKLLAMCTPHYTWQVTADAEL